MVYLNGPARGTKRIRLHDAPPGYHPPRPRMSVKDRQRKARRDWILEHIAVVVLVPSAAVVAVIIGLMIAGYR